METIRVNMTPCEDIKTIHASQNDNEARQWGFELHNNGEKIDSSSISDQLVFKAYEGGTEEILPTNGSTPTTSPFIGDIKYPQGLLSDQEFLYRESPTEEDGYAKIQTIYGNTIKWNQLVQNGRETATVNGVTFTNNGDNSWNISGTATANVSFNFNITSGSFALDKQGIYFVSGCPSGGSSNTYSFGVGGLKNDFGNGAIWKNSNNYASGNPTFLVMNGVTVNFTNVKFIICNLTQMFGTEKAEEIFAMGQTDGIAYFRSLYPLPYYQYDSGSLLPFRGEGLKTVGKNLFDGVYNNLAFGNTVAQTAYYRGYTLNVSTLKGKQITVSRADTTSNNRFRASFFSVEPHDLTPYETGLNNGYQYYSYDSQLSFTLTVPNGANYLLLYISNNRTVAKDLMIEIGSTVSDYVSPLSSITALPISTYFPNGMKRVGNVYDELTETKAITRVGMVDLGTLDYDYISNSQQFRSTTALQDAKLPSGSSVIPNAKCALYNVMDYVTMLNSDMSLTIIFSGSISQGRVWIRNSNYTDVTAFKTAMSGVYLYYELSTPTETSFTTASLVTENAEIPLSNEDGTLIGKCTEQLSSESGFFDAKIKLADEDGECYSNKIQLHIERSPQ